MIESLQVVLYWWKVTPENVVCSRTHITFFFEYSFVCFPFSIRSFLVLDSSRQCLGYLFVFWPTGTFTHTHTRELSVVLKIFQCCECGFLAKQKKVRIFVGMAFFFSVLFFAHRRTRKSQTPPFFYPLPDYCRFSRSILFFLFFFVFSGFFFKCCVQFRWVKVFCW